MVKMIAMDGNEVIVSRKEMDERAKEMIGKKMERMRQDSEGIITLHYGDVPDWEKVKRNHHRFMSKVETIWGEIRNQGCRNRVGDDE